MCIRYVTSARSDKIKVTNNNGMLIKHPSVDEDDLVLSSLSSLSIIFLASDTSLLSVVELCSERRVAAVVVIVFVVGFFACMTTT